MKANFVIVILLLSLVSCSGLRRSAKPVTTHQVKDSTYTTVTYIPRDTTLIVPADSAFVSSLISELSEKPIFQKSKTVTVGLRKVGNSIEAECHTDELELQIEWQEKMLELYRDRQEKTDTLIESTVKYIPKVVKWLAWIGGGLLLMIITATILRIKKII